MWNLGQTEWETGRYRGKKGAKEWAGGKGMNEWRMCSKVGGRKGSGTL